MDFFQKAKCRRQNNFKCHVFTILCQKSNLRCLDRRVDLDLTSKKNEQGKFNRTRDFLHCRRCYSPVICASPFQYWSKFINCVVKENRQKDKSHKHTFNKLSKQIAMYLFTNFDVLQLLWGLNLTPWIVLSHTCRHFFSRFHVIWGLTTMTKTLEKSKIQEECYDQIEINMSVWHFFKFLYFSCPYLWQYVCDLVAWTGSRKRQGFNNTVKSQQWIGVYKRTCFFSDVCCTVNIRIFVLYFVHCYFLFQFQVLFFQELKVKVLNFPFRLQSILAS